MSGYSTQEPRREIAATTYFDIYSCIRLCRLFFLLFVFMQFALFPLNGFCSLNCHFALCYAFTSFSMHGTSRNNLYNAMLRAEHIFVWLNYAVRDSAKIVWQKQHNISSKHVTVSINSLTFHINAGKRLLSTSLCWLCFSRSASIYLTRILTSSFFLFQLPHYIWILRRRLFLKWHSTRPIKPLDDCNSIKPSRLMSINQRPLE